MLTIDEPTWNALLDEARAVIDRRNAQCTGNYAKYSHSLRIQDSEHYTLAIAEQKGGWRGVERHGLGWRKSTGALHGLKFTKMKGAANRGQYYMQPKPQPKSWDRLNGSR